jgi:hypothetical protein
MSSLSAPQIYVRLSRPTDRLPMAARWLAAGIGAACLALMIVSASLKPNPAGVGTHTALGLSQCQFLARWGIPCPGCGMTTSFSWFARGNIEASLYIQPMGTVLALLAAATFWGALYVAISGKPAYRLALRIPSRYYLWYLPSFAIMAWAWKIWIHVHRFDGWH